eukprot:jgi/Undpi1/2717/HiC_scaffold_14.g06095.m1
MIVEVRIMFRGTVKGGAHRDRGGRRQVEAAGQAEQRMDNPQTCGLGVVNAISPKAVRSRPRPPLSRSPPKTRSAHATHNAHGECSGEPSGPSDRRFRPLAAGRRLMEGSRRRELPPEATTEQKSILSKYVSQSLPAKLSAFLSAVAVAVAAIVFFGEGDGPKLVKRDAPLVPGDRLKGGQYISFCTSIISTGCEPKFFELGRDGSLGMYGGRAPDERTAKIWTAGTGSKGSTESAFELVYSGERVSLHKDGKTRKTSGQQQQQQQHRGQRLPPSGFFGVWKIMPSPPACMIPAQVLVSVEM